MALKVHASARDISWGMVDEASEMIAKLAVRGIDFTWLSRQDGSTVNNLIIMDLQVSYAVSCTNTSLCDLKAFDGSIIPPNLVNILTHTNLNPL